VAHPARPSVEWRYVPTEPAPDPALAALLAEEQARAESLLNRIRAAVVGLLGLAALVYAPKITPALARVNIAVLVPVMAWTAWQQWRYHRPGAYRRWLAWVNPTVDVAAITLLQAGYGLFGGATLAVHTPVFLAYFAVLASRPLTGSSRAAGITTIVTAAAYGTMAAVFLGTGRLQALATPLDVLSANGASMLDEGTKVLLLLTVGAISTYATAWNERTLRRALAAQVRRGAEERELAARLQEADKLSSLGTIAAAAVHEVRNPLTTIGLQAELLLRTKLDAAQREDVEHVLAEARRAATFVEDLLRVTRSSGTLDRDGPVSLPAVVQSALTAARPLLRDQAVVVKASLDVADDGSTTLYGSAAALERAVLNLVVNAVQAMEAQAEERRLQLDVTGSVAAARCVLVVRDSGPGFPAGTEDRAFERFYTTKPPGKGTGLGLWIVRETVAMFGGTVVVEPTVQRGATIRLEFPLGRAIGPGTDAPAQTRLRTSPRGITAVANAG